MRLGPDFKEITHAKHHNGNRAAKTLAMRGLGLRDSIQLVTWLHGLPTTGAKDFLKSFPDFDAGLPPSYRNPRPGGMRANSTS